MQVATVSEGSPFSLSEMHRYRIYSEHCVACKIKKIHYRLHTFSADDCRPSRVGNCSCKKFWANEMCSSVSISPSRTCSMLFLFSDGVRHLFMPVLCNALLFYFFPCTPCMISFLGPFSFPLPSLQNVTVHCCAAHARHPFLCQHSLPYHHPLLHHLH